MAKFINSRVNSLKSETKQISDFIKGKTSHDFPMIVLSIILFSIFFMVCYIYFNVIKTPSK